MVHHEQADQSIKHPVIWCNSAKADARPCHGALLLASAYTGCKINACLD